MCGIAGIYNPAGGIDVELLCRMRDSLLHRGPDDVGLHVGDHIGLGFRRLSIIDLVTGHQPLSNETRRVWAAFNGEIYNYRELRDVLRAKGHRFETQSDTECLVHGYEEWGESLFARLNGMFAIAIWDDEQQQLVLARDRAGEKPLYYQFDGAEFTFASELKGLLQHPRVARSVDWVAFDEYCSFGYISAPRSILRDVVKVPAGHYLVVNKNGLRVQPYWRLDLTSRFPGTYADAQAECLRLLDDAVRMRMVSDVPLGAFLSGGLDSSAVVACMARHSTGPVKTFSIGFDQAEFDETSYAHLVATRYGTDNTRLVVTPRYVDKLEDILLNFDEPFADSSALPTFLVSQLTRTHVTVALSGDGGDEVFGGYPTYSLMLRLARWLGVLPEWVRHSAAAVGTFLPGQGRFQRRARFVGLNEDERFVRFVSLIKPEERSDLYTDRTKMAIADTARVTREKARSMGQDSVDYANRMQLADFMGYLPDDILVKVDRTAMLVSLETRAPFLDHRLVEFAFSLPGAWKVSPTRSKMVLRDALSGHLPTPILTRRKQGFSVPLRHWLAGDLHHYCRSRVLSAPMTAIFSERVMQTWLREHREQRRDHSTKLWVLLAFALWLNKHGASP